LRIQEAEKAVGAYEQAAELCGDESNVDLTSKIAQAFIITHEYGRAVQYYEDAIRAFKNSGNDSRYYF
jgi:hypothetical protein